MRAPGNRAPAPRSACRGGREAAPRSGFDSARCFGESIGTRVEGRRGIRIGRGSVPSCYVHLRGRKPKPLGYPTELRTVGDHLKRRRMDLEVQQRQLTDELGVKAWNLRLWEAGRSRPAIRYWPGIIYFLGYEPWSEPQLLSERLVALRKSRGWSQTWLRDARHDPVCCGVVGD